MDAKDAERDFDEWCRDIYRQLDDLEISLIAPDISRRLQLNEDFVSRILHIYWPEIQLKRQKYKTIRQ